MNQLKMDQKMKLLKLSFLCLLLLICSGCPSKVVPGQYRFDSARMIEMARSKGARGRKFMIFRSFVRRVRMKFTLYKSGRLVLRGKLYGVRGARGRSTGYWLQSGGTVKLVITRLASGRRVRQVFRCDVQGRSLACKIGNSRFAMHFSRD